MNSRAIIWDMDGVIVDSEPLHERAFLEVFDEMGYGQTHGINFADYYGKSDQTLWVDFVAKHRPAQSLAELVDWKQRHFLGLLRAQQPIFPEIPDLLVKLGTRYQFAVASGSWHVIINEVLALRDLRRFFPAVVSSQDVPRGKPAPDVFLRAAELLGVAPADCWVIEDSAAGVTAARAAGMQVIGITNSVPANKLAHANKVVRTYAEIEALLLG